MLCNEEKMSEQRVLTEKQYDILHRKGTEPAFSGKYYYFHEIGTYVCAACGNPIFSSEQKFDCGCGWPSFDASLPKGVKLKPDYSHGMRRVEVLCANCHAHLGHVFADGPTKTKARYCINSLAMDFCPNPENE